jgi:hypothetical protein
MSSCYHPEQVSEIFSLFASEQVSLSFVLGEDIKLHERTSCLH